MDRYTTHRITLGQANLLSRRDLARRWAEQPPGAQRQHLWQLLEGPGLSSELEELAIAAALAEAVTRGVGEMIHRAAFIGAELEQLGDATGLPRARLADTWLTWAGPERAAGRIPVTEFQFVADRLAGSPHEPYQYPRATEETQPPSSCR